MQKTPEAKHVGGKRIAKNTMFMYAQSILSMLISLYTSRVVLKVLGVDDYGVYGVVGGIVGMLSIVTSSLQISTGRFFTYALGTGNLKQLNKVFNTSMVIFLLMGVLVVILGETIGLWLLNYKMDIPDGSMNGAHWVYQLSILSFVIGLTATPYGAAMSAHEKFDVLTYLGLFSLLMRLGIVFLLLVIPGDKLKVYAILGFAVGIINTAIYRIYCIRKFSETKLNFSVDKSLFKEIFSYSGWNVFGQLSGVLKDQGVNIMINIFFGAALNASRTIAYALSNSAGMFVGGMMGATVPQIVKSYAAGDIARSYRLVNTSAKLSFFLLFLFALPIFFETEVLLKFWLGQVPEYVVLFVRLILIEALIAIWSTPLMRLIQASGKIKWYQVIVGSLVMLNLPVGYIVYKLGGPPASIFYVFIAIGIIALFLRLYIIERTIDFKMSYFLKGVILPCILVWACSFVTPLILEYALREHEVLRFISVCTACGISTVGFTYLLGLNKDDKELLHKLIKDKIVRKKAIEKQEAVAALEETTTGYDLNDLNELNDPDSIIEFSNLNDRKDVNNTNNENEKKDSRSDADTKG